MTNNDDHMDPTREVEVTGEPDRTEELQRPEATEQVPRAGATEQVPLAEPAGADRADGPERTEPFWQPQPAEQPAHAAPAATVADTTTQAPPAERPTGPYLPPLLLGLICLAVAGLALWQELADVSIDWGNVGPLGIVAVGGVLVLLGVVGLLGNRRRTH